MSNDERERKEYEKMFALAHGDATEINVWHAKWLTIFRWKYVQKNGNEGMLAVDVTFPGGF